MALSALQNKLDVIYLFQNICGTTDTRRGLVVTQEE